MTQLISEITGVVVDAIITICGLIFTGVFIPWLVKTGIPWLKDKRLYGIITVLVKAAEKQAAAGSLTIPKFEYVEQMLAEKGIKVTPEVKAMIEAAVKDLDIAINGAIGEIGNVFIESTVELDDAKNELNN